MDPIPSLPTPIPASSTNRRVGLVSAAAAFFLGLAYLATGLLWLATRESTASAPALLPSEPFLTVLEALILLSAPVLVVLLAAVHAAAPRDARVATLSALGLTIAFAVLTSANHFLRLTIARQLGPDQVPEVLFSPRWPSASLAVDFLAWGPMLGLAFLLAAVSFRGGKLQSAVRTSLIASGAFNFASVLGPATGDLRFSLLGIAGWMTAIVAFGLLAVLYARPEGSVRRLLAGAGMSAWADESLGPAN